MRIPTRLAGPALAAALLLATTGTASAHSAGRAVDRSHPVFVQTAEESGNTVVAYDRTRSGGLVRVGAYPTGGVGSTLDGAVADQLASQGSLTYDPASRLLYAVNSGSNSITTFTVKGDRLVRRGITPSRGEFPVSVTVHDSAVYVLNARAGGSLQGFRQTGHGLTPIPGSHQELGFDPTASPEFVSTPGEVAFTPDGTKLVVSTKLDGNSILVFPVTRRGPAQHPVVNTGVGAVPFGFVFDRAGNLVLTEAGPGTVSTYRIGRGGRLGLLDSDVTGGMAVCWVVGDGSRLYVSNTGSDTLSQYAEGRRGRLTKLGDVATGAGPVDSAVSGDGRYLYVQTGGDGGLDAFRISRHGLTRTATVAVPGGLGGQGLVAL